jgi:hypothetical protein
MLSTSFKSIAYFTILLWYGMIKDVQHISTLPVVPHKAAAHVSKIGNLYESLVVVNNG